VGRPAVRHLVRTAIAVFRGVQNSDRCFGHGSEQRSLFGPGLEQQAAPRLPSGVPEMSEIVVKLYCRFACRGDPPGQLLLIMRSGCRACQRPEAPTRQSDAGIMYPIVTSRPCTKYPQPPFSPTCSFGTPAAAGLAAGGHRPLGAVSFSAASGLRPMAQTSGRSAGCGCLIR
jgi:hypothetical protein